MYIYIYKCVCVCVDVHTFLCVCGCVLVFENATIFSRLAFRKQQNGTPMGGCLCNCRSEFTRSWGGVSCVVVFSSP